jgi:tetratricopeptide (TPR) repeat protein
MIVGAVLLVVAGAYALVQRSAGAFGDSGIILLVILIAIAAFEAYTAFLIWRNGMKLRWANYGIGLGVLGSMIVTLTMIGIRMADAQKTIFGTNTPIPADDALLVLLIASLAMAVLQALFYIMICRMRNISVLKPAALVLVIGGIFTIIIGFYVFVGRSAAVYGTLVGVLIMLLYLIIGGLEVSTARPMWRSEQGGYRGIMVAVGFSMLLRLYGIFLMWQIYGKDRVSLEPGTRTPKAEDLFLTGLNSINIVIVVAEWVILWLVYTKRETFMPSQAEIQATLKRVGGPKVHTVSECPNCHELVEKDWELCPQCGTRLPRRCANCGAMLPPGVGKCPNCGVTVVRSEAVLKSIQNLMRTSEEEARPEARSVRYARLAEAYLKAGEPDQALEAYRKAVHYTDFDRKRTNFMVKMAVILHNAGRNEEASKMIEGAMQLDPQDFAGASVVRDQIAASGLVAKAKTTLNAGRDEEALAILADAVKLDKQDASGAQALTAKVNAGRYISKAKELQTAGKTDDALKQLDEALKADPEDQGKAQQMKTDFEAARPGKK